MLEKVRFYPVSMGGGGTIAKKVPHLFKKTSFFNVKKVNVRKIEILASIDGGGGTIAKKVPHLFIKNILF